MSSIHNGVVAPLITRAEVDDALALICAYCDQDPSGMMRTTIESTIIKAGLVTAAAFAPPAPAPSRLSRPLPDDLSTLSLVQVSLHDNWGRDTKPRGRASNGKTKRPREKATRYAVTVQAWDQPGASITLRHDFGFHLIGDLYDAEGFRRKGLELRNLVERKDGAGYDRKTRNLVQHPISEDALAALIELTLRFSDPAYRFAVLTIPKKRSGCPVAEFQFVSLKLGAGGQIESAQLHAAGGSIALPSFSRRQSSGDPFDPASKVVSQARYASPSVTGFTGWATK